MKLNTDEKIRLGMAFNNAATLLQGKGYNRTMIPLYRETVRELYDFYTEEVEYQENFHDEERRKKDEIEKKTRLTVEQETGQTG